MLPGLPGRAIRTEDMPPGSRSRQPESLPVPVPPAHPVHLCHPCLTVDLTGIDWSPVELARHPVGGAHHEHRQVWLASRLAVEGNLVVIGGQDVRRMTDGSPDIIPIGTCLEEFEERPTTLDRVAQRDDGRCEVTAPPRLSSRISRCAGVRPPDGPMATHASRQASTKRHQTDADG
jgi:hypothetical protein